MPRVLRLLASCLILGGALAQVQAADLYVSLDGAGRRDGSSREHAATAKEGRLQTMWDALPVGGTLWLAPGEYRGITLEVRPSSSKGERTLSGESGGDKKTVFVSDFDKKRPAKTGGIGITVLPGVSDLTIRNVNFRDMNTAIHLQGGHERVLIETVRVTRAREGIRSEGLGRGKTGTKSLTLRDCEIIHFTKRGLRLLAGHESVRVDRCRADAGGKEWDVEPFQMGFAVEAGCHEIDFIDCEARGSHHDHGKSYWNGDGFCAESGAGTVRWKRCRAFDNTDGGWDTKADLSVFEDCVALRNKRNYRVWGKGIFTNCLSAFPLYPGGSGGSTCLWIKGAVTLEGCTLVGDSLVENEDGGSVTGSRSLLVLLPGKDRDQDEDESGLSALEGWANSEVKRMEEAKLSEIFHKPLRTFERGTGFDRVDGNKKVQVGYGSGDGVGIRGRPGMG